MVNQIKSLSDLNQQNREFWEAQVSLLEERMADACLRDVALDTLVYERKRGFSIYFQPTLEAALGRAVEVRTRILSYQARKGRAARKPDPLTAIIEAEVKRRPKITLQELHEALRAQCCPGGVIEDAEDETIGYLHNGRSKEVAFSALKDRLSRAKKKFRSR